MSKYRKRRVQAGVAAAEAVVWRGVGIRAPVGQRHPRVGDAYHPTRQEKAAADGTAADRKVAVTDPRAVAQLLRRHFGGTAVVEHRLNPSNPRNLSFAVDAGADRLWVKVAPDAGADAGLDRWAAMAQVLAKRYCAPTVLDKVTIGGAVALLFPRLELPHADADYLQQNLAVLLALLDRLHTDDGLRSELGADQPVTAGEVFRWTWIRRFTDDLELIGDRVPFVDDTLLRWMRTETEALELSTWSPAFGVAVRAPMHGDLWAGNVLVAPDRFWILDWDDLTIGDPVVDDAVLLFNVHGADVDTWGSDRPSQGAAERQRFVLSARAQLLDRVIDTLADWVELPASTPAVDKIRTGKESEHRAALAEYRERFGGDAADGLDWATPTR